MSDDQKYDALKLGNQLCFPLYAASREVVKRYRPFLEPLDLTYTQYVVMMYFWEMGGGSATDVSRALLLDPSTLTPILKKLEQKGYLDRARDPADERNLVVALTDAGAALRDAALDIPARMGCALGLTPQEAETLCGLIGKILNNIEKEL